LELTTSNEAGSPAQLFINHQVNNLIREIQQVRPHFTYNSIRPAGQPYNRLVPSGDGVKTAYPEF
jgi:hypothetical protein